MEHQFNVEVAKVYGVEESILIHNIFFWIKKNVANDKHKHNGRYWTYNSSKAFSELFPYFNEKKISRLLAKMCNDEILVKGNFNQTAFDRTLWYSLSDKTIAVLDKEKYDISQMSESYDKKRIFHFSKMGNGNPESEKPIPYSNTNSKQDKEEIDKSISKKERAQELIDLWNNETKDFPKVRKASPDIINSIDKMLKRGYSYEDMKKAVILCNSLSDFYKGKERGKTWKATFQWLIHNTNDNFDKIINGALHTSQEQQRIYQSIMDEGVEAQLNKYNPYTEGYHLWLNENDGKYYFTGNIINLADGYTKDNRPNGAQVHQNGYTYTWNATSKEWERG